jgi:vesicular inhibitory amino acid transporter
MVIAFLIIMPTMWTTQMSKLSYFSILGFLASLFCLYTVLYVGFATDVTDPGFVSGSLLHPQPVEPLADAERIPLAIGLTMVAFGGHSVFPSICSSLENRACYPRVVDVSYLVAGLVYGVIELCGYLMYGVGTKKEITLNLIASYPGALTTLVVWMIVLNPMSKIAITIHPVALAIEEFLLSREEMVAPTSRMTAFYRAFIRTTIAVGAVFCGLFVPHFARLTSFIGAFFAMMVSIFFPCVFYLKLFWHRLSRFEVALNVTLAALSIVFAFVGTIASFVSPAE